MKLQSISSPTDNGEAPAFNVHNMTAPQIAAPIPPVPVLMATRASLSLQSLTLFSIPALSFMLPLTASSLGNI